MREFEKGDKVIIADIKLTFQERINQNWLPEMDFLKWQNGKIISKCLNNYFDVQFDNGDVYQIHRLHLINNKSINKNSKNYYCFDCKKEVTTIYESDQRRCAICHKTANHG